MKTYKIQDREAGNVIENNLTLDHAHQKLKDYEAEDKSNGDYVEDFYEIVEDFTTIYRVDNYKNNMGNFEGFYLDMETAKLQLEFENEVHSADGTFSQITEFTVSNDEFEKGDINDEDFMMKLWGESEITEDYYFIK